MNAYNIDFGNRVARSIYKVLSAIILLLFCAAVKIYLTYDSRAYRVYIDTKAR